MNNKLINDKKHRLENYIYFPEKINKKKRNFFDFRSDPDSLFLEVDPRIQFHIKMKWIRNTIEPVATVGQIASQ